MLNALVPPARPDRRSAAFFRTHALSGTTYATRSGAVVPNELQYYDGEMVHLHGECANIAAVSDAIAGSGYRPVLLAYPDGRQAAVVQVWSSRFTDTTIGPYSAMFLVVVVVPMGSPVHVGTIAANPNGLASILTMVNGTFDAAANRYENTARLFMVRLVDTTQLAIDFGRERMGTDKRPGTVDVSRDGRRVRIAVADSQHRAIVRADFELAPDPAAFEQQLAAAAGTAGIACQALPSGTEYVYPVVARIGHGPVVSWQWRTDVPPALQPAAPDAVSIDSRSEEGAMLTAWRFTPRVFGYIASLRGVITGLVPPAPSPQASTFTMSPAMNRYDAPAAHATPSIEPRWPWNRRFLGTMAATLRKESIGVTPDGLRINWHVTEGSFVGPGIQCTVLPGGADWMRIRPDGVGIMNVQATLDSSSGARIYASYVGHCDFGQDGYARALRGDFGTLPSVVVTPSFATQDAGLSWLNRMLCVGIGRVDTNALRIEFDVYAVEVGTATPAAASRPERAAAETPNAAATLFDRMGGRAAVAPMAVDFINWVFQDDQLGRLFSGHYSEERIRSLRENVVDYFCRMAGGTCVYKGRDMKSVHAGLGITTRDWNIARTLLMAALTKYGVRAPEQREFMDLIDAMKGTIIDPSH